MQYPTSRVAQIILSPTGNKLLNTAKDGNLIRQWSSETSQDLLKNDGASHFHQGDEISDPTERLESVTQQCELLSNESELTKSCRHYRVLDIPGFADSTKTELGVFEGNLEIMRQIVRIQAEQGIALDRVLYFLPERVSILHTTRSCNFSVSKYTRVTTCTGVCSTL